jgi:serine/threonine protein kinase
MILTVGLSVKDDKDNLYILDEIIGQGGFGYVFKSHREKDNAVFAVKTTLPSFSDSSSVLSFKNEICSATKVSGENVILYEYVHDGDAFPEFPPYIIMEYADGGTLGTFLDKRKQGKKAYTSNELVNIFKQLAEGMRQINNSLVHRDIKPDNILLCGNTFKISDFGLSKVAAEVTRTMSFKGGGTPLYMAPEAWDFSKNTIQMDIYSMGIVFYELAALQYPYTPLPNTLEECRSTHLYSSITSLSKINPHLPPSLASVINRMLEKSVKSRFSTWDEIIKLLDAQIAPNSPVDQIVARAVAAKNAEDIARQQREATFKQQKKEKEDFLRLVYSQFEQTIIAPIIEFAEKVNLQYAGKDKLTFPANQYVAPDQTTFFWKLIIPPNNSVTINLEVIRKENFIREVYVDRVFNENRTRKENYIPQYKGKNILAWGEITNKSGYGFNIILLDNGDIYGDWIIMNNKNNFSHISGKERREPFAFSLQELPTEIDKVQITHLYSADFNEFSETSFLKLIQTLSFDLV